MRNRQWHLFRYLLVLACGFIFLIAVMLFRYPADRDSLKVFYHAGPNVFELFRTLDHYRKDLDPRKYEAAKFLIRNMDLHYYREDAYSDYKIDWLAENLDQIRGNVPEIDDSLEVAWADFRAGKKVSKIRDARTVKASFLIAHMDQAFKTWDASPWRDRFSFNQFCQYFLPYKTNEARPELWMDYYQREYSKYTGIMDEDLDVDQLLLRLYDSVYWRRTEHDLKIRRHLSVSEMEKLPIGNCRFDSNWLGMIARSLGLPVADIQAPYWANTPGGHYWNAWLDSLGHWKEIALRYRSSRVVNWESSPTKVFIRLWGKNDQSLPWVARKSGVSSASIPENLNVWNMEDVTRHIIPASDLTVKLDASPPRTKFAYLAVYKDREWIPVHWAEVKNDSATFNDMGRRAMYMPLYYEGGEYIKAGSLFYLDDQGSMNYPAFDTSSSVELNIDRVYPLRAWIMENHAAELVGASFEGSHTLDFTSFDTLHLIKEGFKPELEEFLQLRNIWPKNYWNQDIPITSNKKYRFIRYHAGTDRICPVGDVEVFDHNGVKIIPDSIYGTTKNPEYLYDGIYGEYFKPSKPGQWAAIDLGRPMRISHIRFIPYDIDPATIQKGDDYQLSMWDGNDWKTIDQFKADKKALLIRIHPNALYLLENKSRFVHARPFIYSPEDDLIHWW